jgi:hypothetical protein
VKAGQFASHGEMFGEIEAESVELSGKVRDGTVIRARSLDIKVKGQGPREPIQFGDCELFIGDEPDKAAAIARASAANQDGEEAGETKPPKRPRESTGPSLEPASK